MFDQKSILNMINIQYDFVDRFGVRFGTHFGRIWEAKMDPRWAKLRSRRLLKRYVFKKVYVHEKL